MVHIFLLDIFPKLNVIVRLEFEIAYNDVIVQYVSNYTSEILPV